MASKRSTVKSTDRINNIVAKYAAIHRAVTHKDKKKSNENRKSKHKKDLKRELL